MLATRSAAKCRWNYKSTGMATNAMNDMPTVIMWPNDACCELSWVVGPLLGLPLELPRVMKIEAPKQAPPWVLIVVQQVL